MSQLSVFPPQWSRTAFLHPTRHSPSCENSVEKVDMWELEVKSVIEKGDEEAGGERNGGNGG